MKPIQRIAIVLGARVLPDGRASAALQRRAAHAAGLWLRGDVDVIVASGGAAQGLPSEAELIASLCREAGVPDAAIILEDAARNTAQNLRNSAALINEPGRADVVLVTDRYHARRVRLMLRRLGMVARIDCPHPGKISRRAAVKLACREWAAFVFYFLRGRG